MEVPGGGGSVGTNMVEVCLTPWLSWFCPLSYPILVPSPAFNRTAFSFFCRTEARSAGINPTTPTRPPETLKSQLDAVVFKVRTQKKIRKKKKNLRCA